MPVLLPRGSVAVEIRFLRTVEADVAQPAKVTISCRLSSGARMGRERAKGEEKEERGETRKEEREVEDASRSERDNRRGGDELVMGEEREEGRGE